MAGRFVGFILRGFASRSLVSVRVKGEQVLGWARWGGVRVVFVRRHFQTTFADLDVIMTLGGGSGAVTLLLTTGVEHVSTCPMCWFFVFAHVSLGIVSEKSW